MILKFGERNKFENLKVPYAQKLRETKHFKSNKRFHKKETKQDGDDID